MFSELAEILKKEAKAIQEYRCSHGGYVPREVFEALLPVSGTYHCFEVLVQAGDDFLFRLREGDETHWAGQYHIPGVILLPTDTWDTLLPRLSRDIGLDAAFVEEKSVQVHTVLLYDEPERGTRCTSTLFTLSLSEKEILSLEGVWKRFTREEIKALSERYKAGEKHLSIVDHHIAITLFAIEYETGKKYLPLVDLRTYLPSLPNLYELQ